MKHILTWLFPRYFMKNPAHFRALGLALVYVGFLLAQLFSFEKFGDVIYGFALPGGMATVWVLAALLPVVEAMALPLLLSMELPVWLRRLSYGSVLAVPIIWLVLVLWLNLVDSASQVNVGIFGATLVTPVGLWAVVFMGLLLWSAVLVVRELPSRPDTSVR